MSPHSVQKCANPICFPNPTLVEVDDGEWLSWKSGGRRTVRMTVNEISKPTVHLDARFWTKFPLNPTPVELDDGERTSWRSGRWSSQCRASIHRFPI